MVSHNASLIPDIPVKSWLGPAHGLWLENRLADRFSLRSGGEYPGCDPGNPGTQRKGDCHHVRPTGGTYNDRGGSSPIGGKHSYHFRRNRKSRGQVQHLDQADPDWDGVGRLALL